MPCPRGSSRPRDGTCISCIGRRILYHWATWKAHRIFTQYLLSLRGLESGNLYRDFSSIRGFKSIIVFIVLLTEQEKILLWTQWLKAKPVESTGKAVMELPLGLWFSLWLVNSVISSLIPTSSSVYSLCDPKKISLLLWNSHSSSV